MITKMDEIMASQCTIVDTILSRYTSDEAGESEREAWLNMSEEQKMGLLTFTIENCSDWSDFETDLVINFNYRRF